MAARNAATTVEIRLAGRCGLECAPCDCSFEPFDDARIERALRVGAARVVLRGAADTNPMLPELVARIRRAGFGEVALRTNAVTFTEPGRAEWLRDLGVDRVTIPLFSHVASVHDRVTGRAGSLVEALVGMRALEAAGVGIEIELLLLSARVQKLDKVVDLAMRAVSRLSAAHFRSSRAELPDVLRPGAWDEAARPLASALELCRLHDVSVELGSSDGIPLCVLRGHPELLGVHRFNPRVETKPLDGHVRPDEPCQRCALRRHCPGVSSAYLDAHGPRGLEPWPSRPRQMFEQSSRSRRRAAEQHRASQRAERIVVRPTVNCNQDCTFCSANETSSNVWPNPDRMRRQIARAARRGVRLISFSGGEPTLTPELPGYVEIASRLGVPAIELVTNGALLDSEARVRRLADAGLTHAFVSLHAHSEELSRLITLKVGDFERTVNAISLLMARGIKTALNHVVNAQNYRHLDNFVRFVFERWGGTPLISFAFVTPQFRALENLHLVPRISDVMPALGRAMKTALELGQPFIIGSRQGIPPCLLGEFRPWSDIFGIVNEAVSEDQHQKQRAPGCDDCRYTRYCLGLWRPYVERYGLGELEPIHGRPFDEADVAEFQRWRAERSFRWGMPASFEEAWPEARDRQAEVERRFSGAARTARESGPGRPDAEVEAERIRLPVLSAQRSRPLRLAMIGTGRRARRLALELRSVSGLAIEAVASPHAPESELGEFGGCPSFRTFEAVVEEARPDAVIVAAATEVHHPIALAALEAGVPALVEKPLAATLALAEEIVAAARRTGTLLMPAHNVLFAEGLEEVFGSEGPTLGYARRCPPSSPDAPLAWSRGALYETLYHALVLTGRAGGGGLGEVFELQHHGVSSPERIRFKLRYPAGPVADVLLDFRADDDVLELGRGGVVWRRAGRRVTLDAGGSVRLVEGAGGEIARMLAAFRGALLSQARSPVGPEHALDVMRTAHAVLAALGAAGAPLDRRGGPKHVLSPVFRGRL